MYCQRCSEKGTHISFLATMQVVVLGIKEVAVVTKGRWNGGRKYYTTVAMFVCHSLNGRTNKTCFQQEFDRPRDEGGYAAFAVQSLGCSYAIETKLNPKYPNQYCGSHGEMSERSEGALPHCNQAPVHDITLPPPPPPTALAITTPKSQNSTETTPTVALTWGCV